MKDLLGKRIKVRNHLNKTKMVYIDGVLTRVDTRTDEKKQKLILGGWGASVKRNQI